MARETKHTPGKWEISNRSEYTVVQSVLNRSIATTGGYSDNQRSEAVEIENKANALLISKAPDMYELLKELSDNPSFSGHMPTTRIKVLELIKTIEG